MGGEPARAVADIRERVQCALEPCDSDREYRPRPLEVCARASRVCRRTFRSSVLRFRFFFFFIFFRFVFRRFSHVNSVLPPPHASSFFGYSDNVPFCFVFFFFLLVRIISSFIIFFAPSPPHLRRGSVRFSRVARSRLDRCSAYVRKRACLSCNVFVTNNTEHHSRAANGLFFGS